jgi:hypothetical protein
MITNKQKTKVMNKDLKLMVLEEFGTELANKMVFEVTEWKPQIKSIEAHVRWIGKNKIFKKSKPNVHILSYSNDCIDLEIAECSDNSVELWWIKIKGDRCKGYGTEVMNHILDTADDLGVKVRVLPVDFDKTALRENQTPMEYLLWLRDWYRSFEFKKFTEFSPELMYYPEP